MILERVVVGFLQTNCYILGDRKNGEAIIIDPGANFQRIINVVKKNNLTLKSVINTHAHQDHIAENDKFKVPVLIHKDDAQFLSSLYRILNDGDRISVGEITLEVIHTPGHTPGGICLKKGEDFIFTGDALFCGGIGRTDFPYGSQELLLNSIRERLLTLNDKMVIYPGHGPTSTIGREREKNPFL